MLENATRMFKVLLTKRDVHPVLLVLGSRGSGEVAAERLIVSSCGAGVPPDSAKVDPPPPPSPATLACVRVGESTLFGNKSGRKRACVERGGEGMGAHLLAKTLCFENEHM